MLLSRAILAAGLAACSGGGSTPDAACRVVGDLSAPVEMELIYRTPDAVAAPLVDGAELPVESPPQGGKVAFVGVRIKNVDLCGAELQSALRDTCTNRVIGIERRPIMWRIADDGFAEPAQPAEISDYTNLPLCPSSALQHDLDGHPYQLEVVFYEHDVEVAEQIIEVTPTCADADDPALCRCECDSDYDLNDELCPDDPDGGIVECP